MSKSKKYTKENMNNSFGNINIYANHQHFIVILLRTCNAIHMF